MSEAADPVLFLLGLLVGLVFGALVVVSVTPAPEKVAACFATCEVVGLKYGGADPCRCEATR